MTEQNEGSKNEAKACCQTLIIPAIDLQGGEAVRLFKGDYNKKTVYSKTPVELARKFESMGAEYLHVVDLDGAKNGNTANLEVIKKIRAAVRIPIQVGGGIRNEDTVALYIEEVGVDRVILGTVAVDNPVFVKQMISKYGAKRIVIGVDVRDGKVATSGWVTDSGVPFLEFIRQLKEMGVTTIIVTDISKDGTMTGPNFAVYKKIKGVNVIISGGVSCNDDIKAAANYYGIIIGKAYYEGKVDLQSLFSAAERRGASLVIPAVRRIIPCLDIKDGKVVKGINFVNLKELGDPVELARKYERDGASEIVMLDITATNEKRSTFFDLLKKVSQEITIPITVGGGIKSIEDFRKAFENGARKVSVNSAAVANPELIVQASKEFGKERIVIAIDGNGQNVVVQGGKEKTVLKIVEWAKKCEELGAGEILLTMMDTDGVGKGYAIAMTKAVVDAVKIPVIASGGCGSIADIADVFEKTGCDAALAASLFHYNKVIIPAIVQDFYTGRVLMLAYVNPQSYEIMLREGRTCFWSRSRKELWRKGETSGDVQIIKSVAFDCDNDTLLIQVEQTGKGACHTGQYSCFGAEHGEFAMLDAVYTQIADRVKNPKEKSYTNYLLDAGLDKICKKLGEETTETIIAAKNNDKAEIVNEIADVTYHMLVLMFKMGLSLRDVSGKLAERFQVQGNLKEKNSKGEV